MIRYIFILLLLAISTPSATAHNASTAYIWLHSDQQNQGLQGEWHIALADVVRIIDLDNNADGVINGQEFKANALHIQRAFLGLLTFADCRLTFNDTLIDHHLDEPYVVLRFSACQGRDISNNISVTYQALFEQDNLHRGILYWHDSPYVFSPEQRQHNLTQQTTVWHIISTYIQQGVWHIWRGFDHWLFLLTLLLPAVLIYRRPHWQGVSEFKTALIELIRIVTAFTIAHSITLSLTVLGWLIPPTYGIETLIAVSVLLVALNNLYPVINQRRWLLAFGFGLLHGFGFASVLLELGLSSQTLGLSLLSFNIGVELGQLLIVLAYFPLAYGLRHSQFYLWFFLRFGSVMAAIFACLWIYERALLPYPL